MTAKWAADKVNLHYAWREPEAYYVLVSNGTQVVEMRSKLNERTGLFKPEAYLYDAKQRQECNFTSRALLMREEIDPVLTDESVTMVRGFPGFMQAFPWWEMTPVRSFAASGRKRIKIIRP